MLKRCEGCGKYFGTDSDDQEFCASCLESEVTGLKHIKDPAEQRFIIARNLVYENPNISPENLVNQMREKNIDMTIKEVMGYVRQGRLTLKNADPNNFCEDCGKRILSGRKCPSCTKKFEEVIKGAFSEVEKRVEEKPKKAKGMFSHNSK